MNSNDESQVQFFHCLIPATAVSPESSHLEFCALKELFVFPTD